MEKILLTRKEAAQALSIGLRTLHRYIVLKEITVRRIGGRVLIPRHELERFARRDHDAPFPSLESAKQPRPEGATA
ncbi:MAG: helix-turn-helix domain-containing protein [Euryarchaeota archaeon]|nr:helix-turn-helix domain-containing protein [Euryarchaeota archaeon]